MLTIDGAHGEGGGQILRTSLSLSMATGTAFRMVNIRARRSRPGLLKQHLTAVHAAAELSEAGLSGDQLGSRELTFLPNRISAGEHRFDIGSAGSATLVLQTVLPALLLAKNSSTIILEGGTHNPAAPPYEFLEKAFLPLLSRMGPRFIPELQRLGFFPRGRGLLKITVHPAPLNSLELMERGKIVQKRAIALITNLPNQIAERELQQVRSDANWQDASFAIERIERAIGPGNVVLLEIQSENLTEVFTGFGMKGVPAEKVAQNALQEANEYLASAAAVGEHLADQLLLPIALGKGGRFITSKVSGHTATNIQTIRLFLDIKIDIREIDPRQWLIDVSKPR